MADKAERWGNMVVFECPGCGENHGIPISGPKQWSWNQSLSAPSFQPSILVRSGPEGSHICHSYVTDGKIQFLGDCTHKLAGQTVPMLDIQKEEVQNMSTTPAPPANANPNPQTPAGGETQNSAPSAPGSNPSTQPSAPPPAPPAPAGTGADTTAAIADVKADAAAVETDVVTSLHKVAADAKAEYDAMSEKTKADFHKLLSDASVFRGEALVAIRKLFGLHGAGS